MPINNIPGVGPTNADIATAVAAPSSSTIATAVAAAVPTLSQINTSVANNAPSSNGWTVISNVTPNNTVSTYTFSSLSGYRTYRLIFSTKFASGLSQYWVRLNGDSNASYSSARFGALSNTLNAETTADASAFRFANLDFDFSSFTSGDVTIENATIAANKVFKASVLGTSSGGAYVAPQIIGQWRNTANITSITLLLNSGAFFTTGNITLLGIN